MSETAPSNPGIKHVEDLLLETLIPELLGDLRFLAGQR
jgi:hypothetical protein